MLDGTGAFDPPDDDLIITDLSCEGIVEVGGTHLLVSFVDDSGIHVFGTLMDLDGPHEINAIYPGPTIEFTAREYIEPGTEFTTYSEHSSSPGRYGVDIYVYFPDDLIGGGVVGSTSVRSDNLKAFVGDPE